MSATLRPYLIALAAVLAAAVVRLGLTPVLGHELPYLTFFGATMIASRYGGLKPGLLATFLSAVAAAFLFVAPALGNQGPRVADVVGVALFCAIGWLISSMADRLYRARENHRLESERFRATLQSIGDGVIVTDEAGRVDSLNPVAEQLTGWRDRDASGRDLVEVFRIVHEETRAEVDNPALLALRTGAIVALANNSLLISKQGIERPIDDTAAPLRGATGSIEGSVLVFRDVSARRRAESDLLRSERELSDFFENASVPLHWVGPDGIILRANRAELEMLGYSADEYVGRHIADFHTDAKVIGDILARLEAREILHNCPAQLRCRDGSVKDVSISSSVRWDGDRFMHTRCVTLDVTDRKHADAMRGLLAAVVESSEDAVISKALDGRILSWNAGAEALFGYSPAEVIGQSIDLLIPHEERANEKNALARVALGERVESAETQRLTRHGKRLDVSLTLSPIRDDAGTIIGASSIARDIRRRKELEGSLRDADRRKDEFLAVLAHELRNPLAPIRNSVAVLQLANLDDPNLRRVGEVIERQSRHMARLLDDLLDVARITRQKLDLRREVVSLKSVLELALEASRHSVDASGQSLSITMPSESICLHADAMRLGQVFSNLVNNASKYSEPESQIRITTRVVGREAIVSVEDDGIGITVDALPGVFNLFSQATHAVDRAQGGLGIGLALVKGLVELHGGRVSARSEGLGRGSVFEVRLTVVEEPQALADSTAVSEPSSAGMRRRVLVADDNRDGAESMALLLQSFGHEARTAYDGAQAIREAESFQPHVVLLDLGMPTMDGFEAARHLRALPGGDTMLLIAITGWGQERDRRRTRDAGFDAHLVKPVDPLAIRELLLPVPDGAA